MAAFRFVHAADIHLDSPLRSLALRDPELSELIGTATRRALINIVDLCLQEKVDALLLAGDLYDGEQTSMKTALFLAAQLRRLTDAAIRVFIIRGNHDAASRVTRELTLPDGVRVFGGRGDYELLTPAGAPAIAIHGVSFARAQAPESLLEKFKPPVADAVNIAMMHTSLGGAPGHDPYAPCSVAELQAMGFRYWALGHIHKRMAIEGPVAIVMPGNPQGRDINESGAKTATLVTVGEDGALTLEARIVAVAQFERVAVDLAGCPDWRAAIETLAAALAVAREAAACDHMVARIALSGETTLAWRLRRDPDLLLGEAKAQAASLAGCWIESLDIACRAPATPTQGPDPRAELRRLIEQDVLATSAFDDELARTIEELRRKLPAELRDSFGADEAGAAQFRRELAAQGAQDALARLFADGPKGAERG